MDRVLFLAGDFEVTGWHAGAAALVLIAGLLGILLVISIRAGKARAEEAVAVALRGKEMERHLAGMLQVQNEMTGRMQTMAEIFGSRSSTLEKLVSERLDAQGQRVGQAIEATNVKTTESLNQLNERLAVIDRAQTNMTALSGQIVTLQSILSNKQTRGAFGQGRMEAIVQDGLSQGAFEFQHTLSTGKRPDCVVFMPNNGPKLVVDAKFPLESWQRLGEAQSPEQLKQAQAGFRSDVGYHIKSIAESYFIPGETQDTAFLFVPSESIFAEIHERFEDLVQKAMRARIMIVSPSILMLSIQVMQALLRDVRMREEAHLIQREVRELLDDVGRLQERVRKLQTHHQQAGNDIGDILTSTGKVTRRSERIASMEFDQPERVAAPEPEQRVAGSLF